MVGALAVALFVTVGLATRTTTQNVNPSAPDPTHSTVTATVPGAAQRVLDPLTITLVLGAPHGDRLPSRIRVENQSGHTVTDPGCRVNANYSYGTAPATVPGTTLPWVVTTRCAGAQDLPDGFSESFNGPTFNMRNLPPGEYLAAIDFGDARSERLWAEFTVDAP